jgi:hypothetical protein
MMGDVGEQTKRYGGIVWATGVGIEDAIRGVKAFADTESALDFVALTCQEGQSWAVVDLFTMNVVAEASGQVPSVSVR